MLVPHEFSAGHSHTAQHSSIARGRTLLGDVRRALQSMWNDKKLMGPANMSKWNICNQETLTMSPTIDKMLDQDLEKSSGKSGPQQRTLILTECYQCVWFVRLCSINHALTDHLQISRQLDNRSFWRMRSTTKRNQWQFPGGGMEWNRSNEMMDVLFISLNILVIVPLAEFNCRSPLNRLIS